MLRFCNVVFFFLQKEDAKELQEQNASGIGVDCHAAHSEYLLRLS
jgi:hypothetical protein